MSRARPLFLVGSKRSGTSLIVNLLNMHSATLVAHEADLIWILYQLQKGAGLDLHGYRFDDAKGLQATLATCEALLRPLTSSPPGDRDVAATFYEVLAHINRNGRSTWDHGKSKAELAWVGDKKPVQHADPVLRSFIARCFPDARYVHAIRDPRYVVASMHEAAREWGKESVPPHWRGDPEDILRHWALHQSWVLELEARSPDRLHRIRLEDLAATPEVVLSQLFAFLELEVDDDTMDTMTKSVWPHPNERHDPLPSSIPDDVRPLLRRFGYARL